MVLGKVDCCPPVCSVVTSGECCIANSHTGCMIGNMPVNILVYADDIVLLSPSRRGLQSLIDSLLLCVEGLDMSCNNNKTLWNSIILLWS